MGIVLKISDPTFLAKPRRNSWQQRAAEMVLVASTKENIMLQYRDASLADREDFTGMNDFDLKTPPLIADIVIDGEPATVTAARDDNDHFRIEIIHERFTACLTGNQAAFAFVQLNPITTVCDLTNLGFRIVTRER